VLINPYKYKNLGEIYKDNYKEANLVNFNRVIYTMDEELAFTEDFVSPFKYSTILLINYAKYYTDDPDILYNTKTNYVFKTYVEDGVNTVKSFNNLNLSLNHTVSSGYIVNRNNNDLIELGLSITDDFANKHPFFININDLDYDDLKNTNSLPLLDPRYYNERHYELDNGCEFTSLPSTGKYNFKGADLIDLNTEIYDIYHKPLDSIYTYGKTELLTVEDRFNYLEERTYVTEIPRKLFTTSFISFISRFKLLYDTKQGVNIEDVYKPTNYLQDERLLEYLSSIKELFKTIGDELSDKFKSNLRIYYYYSQTEDIVTVYFRDKDNLCITDSINKEEIFHRVTTSQFKEYFEEMIDELEKFGIKGI
jgi:hypothetical protein